MDCETCGDKIPWTTRHNGFIVRLSVGPDNRRKCLACLPYKPASERNRLGGQKRCENCGQTFMTTEVIDGKKRDLYIRRYCLSCSPFNASRPQYDKRRQDGLRHCGRCEQDRPIAEFLRPSTKTGLLIVRESLCSTCRVDFARERRREFKQRCIDYKGGQCEECGYCLCIDAMSFHHRDSSEKDFEISRVRSVTEKAFEMAKPELDKCRLLCVRCHAEEHAIQNGTLIREASSAAKDA